MNSTVDIPPVQEMDAEAFDVIIIGAGLSGIGTAVRLQRDCCVGLRCRHRIWPCPVEHRDFSAARLRLLRYNHAAQNHQRTMYPTHTVDHAVCGQSVPTEERRRTLYK